jgi:hypothetical protein
MTATPTQDIKSICVYCGSSNNVDDAYKQAAIDFGKIMAENGIKLVYGGGRVGLMGLIADTILEHGGEVIGVIPEHLSKKEVAHTGLTTLHVVDSMHSRKQKMVDESDAFVVLPGGVGTLDETCEIITWRQLGIHDKPICIANINGYWSPFTDMINHIIKSGFMREGDINTFIMVNKTEEILPKLKDTPQEKFDPATKWI